MNALAFRPGDKVQRVARFTSGDRMRSGGQYIVERVIDAPDDLNDGCIKLKDMSGYWNPEYFDLCGQMTLASVWR